QRILRVAPDAELERVEQNLTASVLEVLRDLACDDLLFELKLQPVNPSLFAKISERLEVRRIIKALKRKTPFLFIKPDNSPKNAPTGFPMVLAADIDPRYAEPIGNVVYGYITQFMEALEIPAEIPKLWGDRMDRAVRVLPPPSVQLGEDVQQSRAALL